MGQTGMRGYEGSFAQIVSLTDGPHVAIFEAADDVAPLKESGHVNEAVAYMVCESLVDFSDKCENVADENPCTIDVCDPRPGTNNRMPVHVANDACCDDGIDCTEDYCDPGTPALNGRDGGCRHLCNNDACDDGDDCTDDYCDPELGCVHVDANCDCWLNLHGKPMEYAWVDEFAFPESAFTVEFWIRTSDTLRGGTPISYCARDADHVPTEGMGCNTFALLDYRHLRMFLNNSKRNIVLNVNTGEWVHVALTWSAAEIGNRPAGVAQLFLDGRSAWMSKINMNGNSILSGGTLVLGQDQDAPGGGFSELQSMLGSLDNIQIWDHVRTADELQVDMHADYSDMGMNGNGLVAQWNFDCNNGAADASGNGNELQFSADHDQVVANDTPAKDDDPVFPYQPFYPIHKK